MADLQVSLGFLLENVADVARELERAGGLAGADFGKGLNEGSKKAFNDLVAAADKAAKEAGLKFNRQKLQFETVKGDIVPPQALASIAKTVKGLDEARKAVETFKNAVQATARQSTSSFNLLEGAVQGVAFSLTNTLTNGLGSALGSLKGMVSGFIELDGELRLAAAAAGETGGYERLSAVVEKVGIDAAGTGKQVAELATSLVRAGFSVKEVENALPGVVRGAEATGTGFEQFGDIVGNTLRGFGLDVEETANVVDIMTKTVNSSNASVEGFGYTMQYVAPIAKALGVSLEDAAAMTGLLANAGIQGSAAGTGMREFLTKMQQAAGGASAEILGLSQGQERLQAVMQKLGASVLDASGKLLPMDQVLIKLKRGMENLSQGDQVQIANILFGDQAGNKVLAMLNQTDAAITKMFSNTRNSAGATDEAKAAMAGFGQELLKLQGTIDSLGNEVGQTFAAGLAPLLAIANQVAGAVSGLPEPLKVTASLLIGFGAAAAAASVGMAALQLTLEQVGGFAKVKTAVMGAAGAIVGPFAASTAVILGIGVAVGLMTGQFKNVDATTKQLIVTIGALSAAYGTFLAVSNVSKLAGIATVVQYIVASVRAWTIATKGQAIAQVALNTIQYGMAGVVAIVMRVIEAYNAFRKSTTLLAGAQAALAVLTGGQMGLAKVALAATAAAGTYALLNGMIQESGQATEELSKEQENLQSEIDSTKKMIADQQEMGISTDAAEKRLAELESKKASLSEPLALSVEIDQAEKKYDQLTEKAKKTAEGGGKAAAEAQAAAAKGWEEFLRAVQSGQGLDSFSEPLREGGKELRALSDQIFELMKTQVNLPLTATAEREQIDKQIAELQKRLDEKKLKLRLELEQKDIKEKIDEVTKKKAEAVSRGAGKKEVDNLDKEMERLILLQARNQKELIGSQAKGAAIAKDNVLTEAQKAAILKTQSVETEARIAREVAAGAKTKSQAAEQLRQEKLLTLEKEKQLKLKELAAIPVANQNTGRGLELRGEIATIDRDVANVQVEEREESLANEISLIGTAKVEYEAYLTKLRAAGAITKNQYDNEILYLQRVAMEREKAVKERELGGIGDQTSREALSLRQEIASIDKGLADNKMAAAENSYEKAVEEADLQKQKLELIAQEIDLNRQSGEVTKASYETALQYAQALLDNAKARQELTQSEFALAQAYNGRQLNEAETRLGEMQGSGASRGAIVQQEREVARIRAEAANLAIQAKKAELAGLADQERLEMRSLQLKQQMALVDQQSRIAQAEMNALKQRQVMIDLLRQAKDPKISNQERQAIREQIALQSKAIVLADAMVIREEERLAAVREINRIEADTISRNQQARRNRTTAELINLGGRFAGGPVDPRFAYTVNELGLESFLSATGTISWIHKPAYGTWSPPARGMVLPAGLSQQLMEAGALPPHPGVPQRSRGSLTRVEQVSQAVSMNMNGNMLLAMRKQFLELGRLQKSIDTLAGKDWSVNVRTPSNAGLIRTLQGL